MSRLAPIKPKEWVLERVSSALIYDPFSGWIIWRNNYQSRFIGKRAGAITFCHGKAYRRVHVAHSLFGHKNVKEHHIAWFLVTGTWPTAEIDHRNGDGCDNRWENLRVATRSIQSQNSARPNSTGRRGVTLDPKGDFRAQIAIPGLGKKHLGVFGTIDEAAEAYVLAAKKYYGALARVI